MGSGSDHLPQRAGARHLTDDPEPARPEGRGLKHVRLVISDAHFGLKAAIQSLFEAIWERG